MRLVNYRHLTNKSKERTNKRQKIEIQLNFHWSFVKNGTKLPMQGLIRLYWVANDIDDYLLLRVLFTLLITNSSYIYYKLPIQK